MRTKIFLAFLVVITLALFSNIAFRHLALQDFDDFIEGGREDRVYMISAALEGGYERAGWDEKLLTEIATWALMLGLEIRVAGADGGVRMDTVTALDKTGPFERRRLEGLGSLPLATPGASFEAFPLYLQGEEIGRLEIRPTGGRIHGGPQARTFRSRARSFLLLSIVGTGAGAFLVGLVFTIYLSRPLRALIRGVRSVQEGRLETRVDVGSSDDEVARLGRAFNAMAETLERQEELRKDLVTDLAHELRTPITIMSGTLEGIRDGVVRPDASALASIEEEVGRMARFVPVVEDLARSESGYFFLKRDPVDLARLVDDVVAGFRPAFEKKGLKLNRVPGPPEEVVVPVDPDKISQVVVNLLSNALRHTEEGFVQIRVAKDGPWGLFEISDTGPGIPAEIRSRIFDRFVRSDGSEGMGIGLTIVRRFVESHDGIVELSDREGGGSVFAVRLPLEGPERNALA